MRKSFRALFVAVPLAPFLLAMGCSAEVPEEDSETVSSEVVTNVDAIMARAQEWVNLGVPYCGGVRGGHDAICGGTCNRPSAPWNGFRSDCSGFVSWTWQIPDDPATATYIRDRGGENGWHTIAPDQMQRGDAVVCNGHIKLFNRFVGAGVAEIYEEYDCGKVARVRAQGFTKLGGNSLRFAGDNRVYHPIRRNALTGPIAPPPPAAPRDDRSSVEASQAFTAGAQQHFFARLPNGDLRHSFWDANTNQIAHDTWGTGIAGDPVAFTVGAQQHVWARGNAGTLEHWFWDANTGKVAHDTWGTGLASDPAATPIGDGQHVWATDAGGNLQHWWWQPGFGGVAHDTWATGAGLTGRPTAMVDGVGQHVFARGAGGSLQHYWWDPNGIHHDTWAAGGLAGDPAARLVEGGQHVWAVDTGGSLQHWWWAPGFGGVAHDTWGANAGLAGRPSTMVDSGAQHVFARSAAGALEHWWWDPIGGIHHDTWGTGIAASPNAVLIGNQQHVWAGDAKGDAQHWWWSPAGMSHDNWAQ